ncbi:hypothetical protein LguiB_018580 [Lonicera macranthoides]
MLPDPHTTHMPQDPPYSPLINSLVSSNQRGSQSPNLSSQEESSSSVGPRGKQSLQELYDVTEQQENLNLFCLFVDSDSINFEDVVHDKKWVEAMNEEIQAIEKNNTLELASIPKGKKAVGVKWVYKLKKNANGRINRYKARLVAKGYSQKHGIDYDELFALVVRLETVRLLISLAAQNKWKIA